METRAQRALRQQCKVLAHKHLEWWRRRELTRAARPKAGATGLTTAATPDRTKGGMVEAPGVEPASESTAPRTSTRVSLLKSRRPRRRAAENPPRPATDTVSSRFSVAQTRGHPADDATRLRRGPEGAHGLSRESELRVRSYVVFHRINESGRSACVPRTYTSVEAWTPPQEVVLRSRTRPAIVHAEADRQDRSQQASDRGRGRVEQRRCRSVQTGVSDVCRERRARAQLLLTMGHVGSDNQEAPIAPRSFQSREEIQHGPRRAGA